MSCLPSVGKSVTCFNHSVNILNFKLTPERRKDNNKGNLAMRHFTSDFIGALTAPFIPSEAIFSCNTKAFGLDSSHKKKSSDLQRNVGDTIYNIQNMCYDPTTFYNNTNIKPSK